MKRKRKRLAMTLATLAAALAFTLGAASVAPAATAKGPEAPAGAQGKLSEERRLLGLFRQKDAELQKLLRDNEAQKKTERIKFLINGIFDFEELGRKALGKKTWESMPPEQRERFTGAFRGMVENASVRKLEAYRSDSTLYDRPEIDGDKAEVTTRVFSEGQESIVVYKLFREGEEWKAWDLVIDDLSTARNYGEQFRKILETTDMDGLIAKLEKKAKSAAASKPTDSVKSKSEKSHPAKTKAANPENGGTSKAAVTGSSEAATVLRSGPDVPNAE